MGDIESKNSYKITLIIKTNPKDDGFSGTYKLDFEDCSYKISGNHMVIESKKGDSIIGEIFELNTIKNYKIWG